MTPVGHVLFGTLGVRRLLLEDHALFVSLEAQARNAGLDRSPGGGVDPNSGGFLAYGTLGAGYQLSENLVVRANLQLPVASALHGVQSEHLASFLTFAYDLAL